MARHHYSSEQQAFYKSYINSTKWKLRRQSRIIKAGHRCEFVTEKGAQRLRCKCTRSITVHHNTYERLGDELDADLDVLCWFHHMVTHLLWVYCKKCSEPLLGTGLEAEQWLQAELHSLRVDVEKITNWQGLPTKDDLINALMTERVCESCINREGRHGK